MRFSLFILLIGLLSGCCKKLCEDDPLVLELKGFASFLVDTVLVTRFPAGDAFAHPIDSLYEYPLSNGRDTSAILIVIDSAVSGSIDYTIRLNGMAQTWQVTQIESGSARCACGNGHYKTIISCAIDGTRQTQKPFQIGP